MRVVLQRVTQGDVQIDEKVVGKTGPGYVALVGFTHTDGEQQIDELINKIIHLRVFSDEEGAMNRSLLDIGGSILSISQFTLYASTKKGRRPSFVDAMKPEQATKLYDLFNQKLREQNIPVETGVFGADMKVTLTNDGPVTILLESRENE